MENKVTLTIEDIKVFVKKNDFSFMEEELIIKYKSNTDEQISLLLKLCHEDNELFKYLPKFIEKNVFKFHEKNDLNIKKIFYILVNERKYKQLFYLFNFEEYKCYFDILKKDKSILEDILLKSIYFNKNDIFFYFFNDNKFYTYIQTFEYIDISILNNNIVIYDFLIENENFYSLNNILEKSLTENTNIYFIKDIFIRLQKQNIKLSKNENWIYLEKSTINYKAFKFFYKEFNYDINKFKICTLLEKSIENLNIKTISFLLKKINFNVKNFQYDFIETFLYSYNNSFNINVFNYNIKPYLKDKEKINIFNLLFNNKYINHNINIEKIFNIIIKRNDVCLIKYLINVLHFNYENDSEISNIRLQESFFYNLINYQSDLNFEDFIYLIKNLNINLYYRNNLYVYKFIIKNFSDNKTLRSNIFGFRNSEKESKKILNYLLSNNLIASNFNLYIIENQINVGYFHLIKKNLKFKNF